MRGGAAISLGAVAALLLLIGLPVGAILLQAAFPGLPRGDLSAPFSGVAAALSEPRILALIGNTLALGAAVSAGCLLLAAPLGLVRGLCRVPGAAAWDVLFLIPFMIPPYIAALAWIMTLQPRGYLAQLAGFDLGGFLFSFPGIVFVMVLNLYPLTYFAVARTVEAAGGRLAEVARVFGASPARALWRITLPLAMPGIVASLLLVFAMAIEEFGTPATLAARTGFHVLVTGIYTRFSDWPIDLPGAAVLSVVLMLLAGGAYALQLLILARRSFVSVGGRPAEASKAPLGRWALPVLAAFGIVTALGVGVPVAAVLATALTRTISGGLAWENLSLVHFAALFANRAGALTALANSLGLAAGAALLTGLVGALVAYVLNRTELPGRRLLDLLSLLPNAIPGIVVAVGLILAWNQAFWPVAVYNTPWMLLIAYCALLLPYPVRYATAALQQIGRSLDDAARVSGAGVAALVGRILLPLLLPSLGVAMLLVFAIATRELVASIMVAPAGFPTVSTFVFAQFEQGSAGVGMAMSVIAIFASTAILVALAAAARRV
ncbi:MAG: iron ABC transporter permease [Acetobacteraceae bacterium]|nr:iron ABC transporter permease [Acetobacteraceae bacterium]